MHRDQHAPDSSVVIQDGAVAVPPVDVVNPLPASDRDEMVFMPGGITSGQHRFDLRAEDGPDLGPAVADSLSQGAGVPVGAQPPTVVVVIELNQLRTPPYEHRVAGVEQHSDGGAQTPRPTLDWTKRRGAPVEPPHEDPHLPSISEDLSHAGIGGVTSIYWRILREGLGKSAMWRSEETNEGCWKNK